MPSAPLTQDFLLAAGYAINAATEAIYRPVVPTRIHRVLYVATVTQTGASAVLTLLGETAGGAALSPVGTIGVMTVTTAMAAANQMAYLDVHATYGDLILYPGEQLSITTAGASAAGDGDLWITVEALGFASPDVRLHVDAHMGSVQLPTAFTNVTEVTS